LLEASVDSLLLSEDTLPKLTAENEHLQKKINDLTQQLDSSDAQLEQERNVREGLEDSRDVRIKEVESSWKAVIDEKKDNWEAKERSLEEKIESQERLLNELKASYEVNQRLGHDGGDVGENRQISASVAELEIVSSDLDRTSQRLAEVEARNEQLRTELAEASSNTHAPTQEDPNNARLRSENSTLLRKLDGMRLEKDTETRKRETRIRSLEKDAQKLDQERESLRERINSWRDYNEIKQELEIFKVLYPLLHHIDIFADTRPVNRVLHARRRRRHHPRRRSRGHSTKRHHEAPLERLSRETAPCPQQKTFQRPHPPARLPFLPPNHSRFPARNALRHKRRPRALPNP